MSQQLVVSFLFECLLVFFTILLLVQPRLIFRPKSDQPSSFLTMSGLFLLCITFCWSVVFGCVVAIHQLTFRI